MMKLSKTLPLVITSLVLTGCGFAYKDAYRGGEYASSNYLENYYDVWNEEIDETSPKNLIKKKTSREVTNEDNLFLSYNSDNFLNVEKDRDNLYYDVTHEDSETYGKQKHLSKFESSFKYGITSKLFDGRMFCEGKYERARMQLKADNKEIEGYTYKSGFGLKFEKECAKASYIALSFRCATNPKPDNTSACYSDIDLHISFYLNDSNGGYNKNTYSFNLPAAKTNNGSFYSNNGYDFVGFELGKNIDFTLCSGISIEYTLNDVYVGSGSTKKSVDTDRAHSLMLYEIIIADSIWH